MQIELSDINRIAHTNINFEICIGSDQNEKNLVILHKEDYSKYISIDQLTIFILQQINKQKTFSEIFTKLKSEFNITGTIDEIFTEFKSTQLYLYLFDLTIDFTAKRQDKYIFPKIILLKAKWVKRLSTPFTSLFIDNIFKPLFFGLPIIITIFFYYYSINFEGLYSYVNTENVLIFYIGYILCILFHEIGHATATVYYGAKPNDIGFGFYLISPVFYCDVTDIWRISNKKRLRVDLAGIYFQWIISLLLIFAFILGRNPFWIYFSFFNFMSSLINLNPFLLYDGYWALGDVLGITNLREKSTKELKQFTKEIFKLKFSKRTFQNYLN